MKKPGMLSIFRYIDPVRYLNDAYTHLRSEDPSFSMRSWSRALGLKSSSALSQILKGHRSIPSNFVPKFAKSLKLAAVEKRYFGALAGIGRSTGIREQELWMKRAQKIYTSVSFELEVIENLRLFDDPLLSSLMALVEKKDFRLETRWIQNRLAQDATASKIRESFEFLLAHGFLAHDSSGRMTRTRNHLWSRQKKLNETALAHAARAVYFKGVEGREGFDKDLPRARRAIRAFTASLLEQLAEESDDSNEATA